MKKKLFAAAAVLAAGSLALLAGCGEATGEISGKYKEATADEVIAACSEVQFDWVFGDIDREGWSFNVQAEEELKAKLDLQLRMAQNGLTSTMTYKTDLTESADYLVSVATFNEEFYNWGAGSIQSKAEGSMNFSGLETKIDSDEEIKVYHDSESIYLDPVKSSDLLTGKTKLSIEDVMRAIRSEAPDFPTSLPFPGELEDPEEYGKSIKALIDSGVKISLDQRKGLKLKLSLDKATVEALIAEQKTEDSTVNADIAFKTFELDCYFAFDEDGLYEGAGIVFDIDMTVAVAMPQIAVSGSIALEGGVSVTATDKTAKLPDGIATDASYLPLYTDGGSLLPLLG